MMRRLTGLGYVHEYVTGYDAEDPAEVLPGVHLVASLLKRWLTGTLHYRASDKHLPYYLDEYAFRFNRRNSRRPRPALLPAPPAGRRDRPAPALRADRRFPYCVRVTALEQICGYYVRIRR